MDEFATVRGAGQVVGRRLSHSRMPGYDPLIDDHRTDLDARTDAPDGAGLIVISGDGERLVDRRQDAPHLQRWAARSVNPAMGLDDDSTGPVLPDPSFDRYARMVQSALNVPTALVTILESDRQLFPGAAGLPEQLLDTRQTPLSHSFCKHVVYDGAPLIVSDARDHPVVHDNPSIAELGVVGYAGYPLRDGTGTVIGSLCALDTAPHDWSENELSTLEDLAALCSTEIVLRELRRRASQAARDAWDVSHRARVLLALSERLADTRTLADVARALLRVATEELDCMHAGIWILDNPGATTLRFVRDPHLSWPQAEDLERIAFDDTNPIGAALLDGEPLSFADQAAQDRVFPAVRRIDRAADGHARIFLPIAVGKQQLGCLVLMWPDQFEFTDEDLLTIGALTASVASAVQRALLLDDRATVASKLQSALLTVLPQPPEVELAARYRAARVGDEVGGDWYDAVLLPSGATTLMIGDVVGHDVNAAAEMGPLRNMLRGFAWDRDDSPSAHITRLDQAIRDLQPGTLSTVIMARIEAQADGRHAMRWTNAGHPAPLLLYADGRCETLESEIIDCLLGIVPDWTRHDYDVLIEPGSTLILFTDGLIETRDEDLDDGRARLIETVQALADRDIDDLVDGLITAMVGDQPGDDVAVLGAHFV